ncbi:MAG: hypothetical protein Q7T48_11495 [Cellvibrio sp.]|uniref:hypothetical protein n=1 Tax=Cellvibrio sp. TaxID=1965322 RepID=UPI002724AB0A|nr:hypothetical protein [Cellvibrio sp.]
MKSQLDQMKWILFWVFLILFVLMVLGTLAMVFFGFGAPTESERSLMVKGLILEVGASILALFYSIFGLNKKSENVDVIQSEKIQELSSSIEELNKKFDFLQNEPESNVLPVDGKSESPKNFEYKSEIESILEGFETEPPFPIEEFKLSPFPKEIHTDLINTKPFDLKHRENSYIGRKVQWKAAFKSINSREKGVYKIVARLDYVYLLIFEVDESTSHFFRNLNADAPFWVCGEITEIDSLFITIKNPKV